MNPLVSICIPTYERPDLLRQAIESCLKQTCQAIEIIVCDDSKNDASEQVIQGFNRPEIIFYYRNQPSLGQAGNVNRLFDLAQGDRLVLLHDDDLLMPNAIQAMVDGWEAHPHVMACFGKQYVIQMDGQVLETDSQELNQRYYRTPAYAGLQSSPLWSAMMGQFPNNGYLVLTEAARTIRYADPTQVGDACDFAFGLGIADYIMSHTGKILFLDQYTSMYRLTDLSVASTVANNAPSYTYFPLQALKLPTELEASRHQRLQKYAPLAVGRAIAFGRHSTAVKIYTSTHYPCFKRFSPYGLGQALLLVIPPAFSTFMVNRVRQFKVARLEQQRSQLVSVAVTRQTQDS